MDYYESVRRFSMLIEETVSIFDVVDSEVLDDPSEVIYDLIDPDEEKSKGYRYKVETISARDAKNKLKTHAGDMTVYKSYRDHADDSQKDIVNDKKREFDNDRIIVVTSGRVLDGNHHLIAAIELNKPVKYIDIQKPLGEK